MSLIRVVKTAASTITQRVYVDETSTDPAGTLAVSVARLDGTVINTGTATDAPGTGIFTYVTPGGPTVPSVSWQLDHLDVSFTGSLGGATVTLPPHRLEIVGGFIFGLAEARASDASLTDPVRYPTQMLVDKRVEVEQECEKLTGCAWVPRFARVTLAGTGCDTIVLPHQFVRSIRAVKTRTWPTEAYTVVSSLAGFAASPTGILTRYDGGIFPAGHASTVIELEHGLDMPPEDLKEASMYRLRSRLNLSRSGVPDRVNSYTTPDGSTFRVTMPTRGSTGIPEVDSVYQRYEAPPVGFA